MAAYSDIDVLFVCDSPLTAAGKKFIEELHQAFWSEKRKLSYSVRTLPECAEALGKDLHFLTSLLDMRYVCGSRQAFRKLEKLFEKYAATADRGAFVAAKLAERDARHKKMGDSRYQLEPNIKESKGALRDLHTLFWIAGFLYRVKTPEGLARRKILTAAEAGTLKKAYDFFRRARWHLHDLRGRADDRLSFEVQPQVALRMGYADGAPNLRAEKFMKDYFLLASETGHLTRILCADLEARAIATGGTAGTRKFAHDETLDRFTLNHNRLSVKNAAHFKDAPADILRIFRVSQISGYDIHPDALRHMRGMLKNLNGNTEACVLFLDVLLDPRQAEQTLRRMNEAGVIAALIPEFANIHAHMQYDMYHVFTADEHTIRACGFMHKIENGDLAAQAPVATEMFSKIHSRRALYAAMFLHDIAKGTGGQHSQKGADIARAVCPRLGLAAEETETAAWLVENHLLMTMTAFKRDLNDPKTIEDFVGAVQSPERLKLLLILTVADIMAVGPERWNNWKAGLLRELYFKAQHLMAGSEGAASDQEQALIQQKKVRRLGVEKDIFHLLADSAPKNFWLVFEAADIARYLSFLSAPRKRNDERVVTITPVKESDHTEVFVYAPDRSGLFATLSGAIAAAGASIVDARIFTLGNGMALDVFRVQSLKGNVYENTNFLQKTIHAALDGALSLESELHQRRKVTPRKAGLFAVQTRVIIDNNASATSTLIEVNGKDRIGFLYDITSAISGEGLQIAAAKVTTFGSRAVDVFYVKDSYGLKILHPQKLLTIEKSLRNALEKSM